MLLDQRLVDVTYRTLPVALRLVDGVHNVEGLGVFGLQCVKLLFEENVGRGHVGENESEAGLVCRVGKSVVENLVHGGANVIERE